MTQEQAQAFVKECDGYYREIVKPFNTDPSRFMIELEYENYFRNIIFVKKKRYAGKMTIFKGKESDYLEVKGLECMRSDGLERARAFQRLVLEAVLGGNHPPASEIVELIEAERAAVFSMKLTGEDVVNTQAIEKSVDDYKTKPPHVRVAEHIRAVSTEYFIGMKVPYVMVPGPPNEKTGRPGKLEAVWLREYVEGTYDAAYVWNKKVYPPTMRVIEAAYPDEDWHRIQGSLARASQGLGDRYNAMMREYEVYLQERRARARKGQRSVLLIGCAGMGLIAIMMLTVLLIIVLKLVG